MMRSVSNFLMKRKKDNEITHNNMLLKVSASIRNVYFFVLHIGKLNKIRYCPPEAKLN